MIDDGATSVSEYGDDVSLSGISQMNDASVHRAVATALNRITSAWGKPATMVSAGAGLTATFKAINGPFEERLEQIGAQTSMNVAAESRRGGPKNRSFLTGALDTSVRFFARCRNTDQARIDIEINLFPAESTEAGALADIADPSTLFSVADDVLGGPGNALSLLPGYLVHHLNRSGPQRQALLAAITQVIADALHESD